MDAARVGLVIWGAVLGYWLLFHGIQRLAQIGQPAHGGALGGKPNPAGWLAQQPMVRG